MINSENDEFSNEKIYQNWENSGAFNSNPNSDKDPYTIMIPPPNVTGNLHIGHALTMTLQDILIRWRRMQKYDSLWQPGTDHAGIATQMMVERQLAEQNIQRKDLTRSEFVEKVWQWKNKYGNNITNQLRELGCSLDWTKERFTLDDDLSHSVRCAFLKLYEEGLIYRDKRLVNWDPKLGSAVSDLEIIYKEVSGHLWYIKYPIIDSEDFIVIATTRPETMLSDVAIAVNPDDVRYKNLIGKFAKIPLINRLIPIISDEYSNIEKGTGAVKITPAHDFNDFEVAKRHNLAIIVSLNSDSSINLQEITEDIKNSSKEEKEFLEKLDNLDYLIARDLIIKKLNEINCLVKIENHISQIPYADRSGAVIQPRLTMQWFCDTKILAEKAIDSVKKGEIKFVPKQWENNFFSWMENIEAWCISRQLWWGHQIPIWYGPDNKIFAAMNGKEAAEKAEKYYGKKVELIQDEDVLDTWFSSALWPFATLGWPDNNNINLKRYYPTDVLVTGFDIIFFWVARMIMMGIHLTQKIPFKVVFIHGLVSDEHGQKMSKTKGNIVDPRDIIKLYGTDAMRWTISSLAGPGRNIKLSEERVKIGRNFVTKLVNIAKFFNMNNMIMHEERNDIKFDSALSHWLLNKIDILIEESNYSLENFRFDEYSEKLYQFIWNIFCDWFIELSKSLLQTEQISEIKLLATKSFSIIIRLLHPIIPFVTEKLWYEMGYGEKYSLIRSDWPERSNNKYSPEKIDEIEWLMKFIIIIRNLRAKSDIKYNIKIEIFLDNAPANVQKYIENSEIYIKFLVKASKVELLKTTKINNFVRDVLDETIILVSLDNIIDSEAEKLRLEKSYNNIKEKLDKLNIELGNKKFMENAPKEIIKDKEQIAEKLKSELQQIENILKSIKEK